MYTKLYDTLPEEARKIREKIFMQEQGFKNEFDEFDIHANHLILYDGKRPIATCRFFARELPGDYVIGRIAVIKEYRGQNIGTYLLKVAETEIKKIGGKRIFLHAQSRVEKFYEKQGYSSFGEIELDEYCSHVWMSKRIEEKE